MNNWEVPRLPACRPRMRGHWQRASDRVQGYAYGAGALVGLLLGIVVCGKNGRRPSAAAPPTRMSTTTEWIAVCVGEWSRGVVAPLATASARLAIPHEAGLEERLALPAMAVPDAAKPKSSVLQHCALASIVSGCATRPAGWHSIGGLLWLSAPLPAPVVIGGEDTSATFVADWSRDSAGGRRRCEGGDLGGRRIRWRVDEPGTGRIHAPWDTPTLAVAGATENGEYLPTYARVQGCQGGIRGGAGSPPRIGSNHSGQNGGNPRSRFIVPLDS